MNLKNLIFFFAVPFFLLNINSKTLAQTIDSANPYNKLQYGFFAHYGAMFHNADFKQLPDVPSCCKHYISGFGSVYDFGLTLEVPFKKKSFFNFRLGYESFDGYFTSQEPIDVGYNGSLEKGVFEHRLNVDFSDVWLGAFLGLRPFQNRLVFYLGPVFNIFTGSNSDQKEVLINPSDHGTFENNSRTRNATTNSQIHNSIKFGTAFAGGVGYELSLNRRKTIRLQPELFYQYYILPLVNDFKWETQSLRLGFSMKFSKEGKIPFSISINNVEPLIIEEYKSCSTDYKKFITTDFSFQPTINAPAGISDWTLTVSNNGKPIKNFAGKNSEPGVLNVSVVSDSSLFSNMEGNIKYSFSASDNYDQSDIVEKSFPINRIPHNFYSDLEMKYVTERKDQAAVNIERTISTNMRPLLNYVFFDERQFKLPQRYIKLNKEDADTFSLKNLHNEATLNSYYHILNIVGKRLREKPEATITIVGCNAGAGKEKNDTNLARNRALTVKTYLQKVWDIDPGRMRASVNLSLGGAPKKPSMPGKENDTADANAENRRVEIIPSDEDMSIIEPVITQDTLIDMSVSSIKFKQKINSNTAIKDWKISISRNDKLFDQFSGQDSIPEEIFFDLEKKINDIHLTEGNFVYKYNIKDIYNQECQADGEIPVKITTRDSSYDKYSLILFEFNSYEIKARNAEIVDLIRNAVKEGADLTVTGYTDRVGDDQTNLRLSKNRALSTANQIFGQKLNGIVDFDVENMDTNLVLSKRASELHKDKPYKITYKVLGVGETQEIFDNSYPEGRFYCRTVTVEIWNPMTKKK